MTDAPLASRGRDYRLDFFRGIALIFIFIDHIPDNAISYLTLRSFAFCDAAEVFIFISGYTAALVYARSFEKEGAAMGVARIYRRVWQLYVAHLCLFMIFKALIAFSVGMAPDRWLRGSWRPNSRSDPLLPRSGAIRDSSGGFSWRPHGSGEATPSTVHGRH